MTNKNFGPLVSGYSDPEGRNFETVVFQAGKPVLDRELNLSQDVDLARKSTPSGWVTDDHLNKTDPLSGVFVPSVTANLLSMSNSLRAIVNGWVVEVQYTDSASANQVSLGAGPSGFGSKRTDLLVLEVWRRLISPSPDTVGKSTGGRIWRNGNVKVPAVNDVALNFADDLLDGIVGAETTKRVQIQYRLRAVSGVDLFAYPSGISDPVAVANSVPSIPTSPNGVATAFSYFNQSANGDAGLWRAGDGNPANTLGTVDGYMYAIPLVAVFRRNTSAFNRNSNHNGGAVTPGPSDRPDGLFSDVFVGRDVVDLRRASSLTGWSSYAEIGEKNFGYLLDNALTTEWALTAIGGGVHGHTVFWSDEIGVLPGNGTTTGDTPGSEFIGQFDSTRRFFTDRPNYEIMTFTVAPGAPEVSTATWQNGTVITINPAAISQYPYPGAIGFLSRAPSGTRVLDVVRARIQGTTGGQKGIDVGITSAGAPSVTPDSIPVEGVSGLGDYPIPNIVITLGTLPIAGLTTEPIYIDLLVAYPSGSGLSKTPSADFGASSFEFTSPISALSPTFFSAMQTQTLDAVHREAQLQYVTTSQTYTFSAETTASETKYFLPERVQTVTAVRVNTIAYGGSFAVDVSGRLLTLSGGPATAPGDVLAVDYTALRPMPQSGAQIAIYYEARAPQTVQSSLLGTSATLIPRWVSPFLYSLTVGSGSQGEAYPYPFAYVQSGGVLKDGSTFSGEHELDGASEVFVAEFNASTGFLKIPAYIPYVPSPEAVTFTRAAPDTDIEGRTYFPTVPPGYAPNAFGQGLSNERVHKVLLPTLMENSADTTLGSKGSLFLVLLVRWAAFDAENSVKFLTANNTTTAAIFRVAGNLLNRRS